MEITGIGSYGAVYQNPRPPGTENQRLREQDTSVSEMGKDSVAISGNADYLNILQKQFPKMTFSIGTGFSGRNARNSGEAANPWAFTVDPKLIEKMSSDPDAEAEFTQRLRDIERATSLAEGIRASLGMKCVYCENYIDGNGQLHHTSISVRKDEVNERLREEAQKRVEELIERTREKNQEAAEKLETILEQAEESGELRLDSEDMRWIGIVSKSADNGDIHADADEETKESSTRKGMVGINAAKLARMLAAAKTQSQVRAVIAQIKADLEECDSGKAQGMDVDEASVEAAEQVLQQAQQRMGQTENREATPEEKMASALASLM